MIKIKNYILLLLVTTLFFGCPNDDELPIEQEVLEDVSYELLFWEFTPDTGNNTIRLNYQIEFFNPNSVAVNGFYKITQNADGLQTSLLSTNFSPCYQIEAESSCIFTFDEEDSIDIAMVNNIEFVSAEYLIEN